MADHAFRPWCRKPPGETWSTVDQALRKGFRHLQGGSSLARLLARHRGRKNEKDQPALSHKKILAWADQHYQRTGKWPNVNSGDAHGAPGERWDRIDNAPATRPPEAVGRLVTARVAGQEAGRARTAAAGHHGLNRSFQVLLTMVANQQRAARWLAVFAQIAEWNPAIKASGKIAEFACWRQDAYEEVVNELPTVRKV